LRYVINLLVMGTFDLSICSLDEVMAKEVHNRRMENFWCLVGIHHSSLFGKPIEGELGGAVTDLAPQARKRTMNNNGYEGKLHIVSSPIRDVSLPGATSTSIRLYKLSFLPPIPSTAPLHHELVVCITALGVLNSRLGRIITYGPTCMAPINIHSP
jgi:hypothetical protein